MTRALFTRAARPAAALALFAVAACLAALPAGAAGDKKNAPQPLGTNLEQGTVAAVLGGKPIYRQRLNSPDLAKARKEVYQLEQRLLQRTVLERLQRERPKEFTPKAPTVSEKEIQKVYREAGLKGRGTLDSFRGRIAAYLIRNKTAAQEGALFEKAVRKGYVKSLLKAPPPYLFRLKPVRRAAASRGPSGAPVLIYEFSDFQ